MEWKGYIPESRWEELRENVAKLNKRAAKIGATPMTLELTGQSKRDEVDYPYVFIAIEIILKGETPKFEGWKLLAVLQHDPNLDANIVKTVPGEIIPEGYRTRPGVCDHCGYTRIRKETFVVQHDSGELKQVGRQCVADFLGHGDPRRFIKTYEWFEEAMGWGVGFSGIRDERENYSLEAFLAMTNAVIQKWGWVSGKKSYETGQTSTATEVIIQFGDRKYMKKDQVVDPTDEDKAYAIKVIEWAKTIDPTSDYLHNLLTIAKQNYVIRKTQGFAASMIMAYKMVNESKKEKKVSGYVGNVGDRLVLKLTFKATYSFDSQWGTVHLHRFLDDNGNVFIWQSSKFINMVEGGVYEVMGTVKQHKDYKDVKQTILTRCKVKTNG
jgi:hypothetical protein